MEYKLRVYVSPPPEDVKNGSFVKTLPTLRGAISELYEMSRDDYFFGENGIAYKFEIEVVE